MRRHKKTKKIKNDKTDYSDDSDNPNDPNDPKDNAYQYEADMICHDVHSNLYCSLIAGIKMFGESGRKAAVDEMKQIHDKGWYRPINVDKISLIERMHAMKCLIFDAEEICTDQSRNMCKWKYTA